MFVYMNTHVRTDALSVHTLIHMSIHCYTYSLCCLHLCQTTRTHIGCRDKQWLTSRVSVDSGAGATCRWAVTLQRVTARDEAL